MPWRLKILDPINDETHSSSMPADRAVDFARDLLASGRRVLAMESPGGGAVLNETEIMELCGRRHRLEGISRGVTDLAGDGASNMADAMVRMPRKRCRRPGHRDPAPQPPC